MTFALAAAVLLITTQASGDSGATLRRPVSLPLEFETNTGQFAPEVLYLARTSNHFVYLTRGGLTFGLTDTRRPAGSLRMTLVGVNRQASMRDGG
jgi:hypothetical protein